MTPADLLAAVRQLRELEKAATPGPWITDDPPGAASVWRGKWFGLVCNCESNSREQDHVADAQFIVAARNLVGPLIEDWEGLRARVAATDSACEALSPMPDKRNASSGSDKLAQIVADGLNEWAECIDRGERLPRHTPSSPYWWFQSLVREQADLCCHREFHKLLTNSALRYVSYFFMPCSKTAPPPLKEKTA